MIEFDMRECDLQKEWECLLQERKAAKELQKAKYKFKVAQKEEQMRKKIKENNRLNRLIEEQERYAHMMMRREKEEDEAFRVWMSLNIKV